jgi:hypothetical protein
MRQLEAHVPLSGAFDGIVDRARHHGAMAGITKKAALWKRADEIFDEALARDGYIENVIEDLQKIGMEDEEIADYLTEKLAFVAKAVALGGRFLGRAAHKVLRPGQTLRTAGSKLWNWGMRPKMLLGVGALQAGLTKFTTPGATWGQSIKSIAVPMKHQAGARARMPLPSMAR